MTQPNDCWYRYDDIQYAPPLDEFDMPIGRGRLELRLTTFRVVRLTPTGAWLTPHPIVSPRFARRDARKRYACPTKQEALESFFARKRRQKSIYEARIRQVEEAMVLAAREQKKLDENNPQKVLASIS